jgi:hypothetical protein
VPEGRSHEPHRETAVSEPRASALCERGHAACHQAADRIEALAATIRAIAYWGDRNTVASRLARETLERIEEGWADAGPADDPARLKAKVERLDHARLQSLFG